MSGNLWCLLGLLLLLTFEAGDAAKIKCKKGKPEDKKTTISLRITSNATDGSFGGILDSFQQQCNCGWRNPVGARIVGGTEAGVNEYPMMAAIIDTEIGIPWCGATIISNKHVLTAAHCLLQPRANIAGILVGDHNLETGAETSATRLFKVARYDLHPFYEKSKKSAYDIAVVTIDGTIEFSNEVGPVCLPFRHSKDDFEGLNVDVLGWGSTFFAGPTSNVLLKTTLTVRNLRDCKAASPNEDINFRHLCTFTPGRDSCKFDSGGPVLWQNPGSGRLVLLGITSFGRDCGGDAPTVNTRVGSYVNENWFNIVTRGAQFCRAE